MKASPSLAALGSTGIARLELVEHLSIHIAPFLRGGVKNRE
jgi:hypothetical protein